MASVRKRTWSPDAGRKVGGKKAGECWEVSWNDGTKRRKKSGFKTKADADAFAVERQKEVNDGTARPQGHRMTLSDLAPLFVDHTKMRVARRVIGTGHLNNMESHIRNYLCRAPDFEPNKSGRQPKPFTGSLGRLTLNQIRPSTVEKYRDDLLATGLSRVQVKANISTLHSMLDFARRRDFVAVNAADRIVVEKSKDERNERVTPPSADLVRRVIEATTGQFQLAVQLSACTGLRAGELRALRYTHIDVARRTVTVKVALDVLDREGPPKSDAGFRTIPVSNALLGLIQAHRSTAN